MASKKDGMSNAYVEVRCLFKTLGIVDLLLVSFDDEIAYSPCIL